MKDPATETEGEDEMTRRYRAASAADPARPSGAVRAAILEQSRLEAAALKAAGLKAPANERQWRLRAVAGLAVVAVGVAVTLQMRQPGVLTSKLAELREAAAVRTPSETSGDTPSEKPIEAAGGAPAARAAAEAADAGVAALRGTAKPEAARQYQQAAQELAARDSAARDSLTQNDVAKSDAAQSNSAQARAAQVAPAAPAAAEATSPSAQAAASAERDASGAVDAAPEVAAARTAPPAATLRFSGDSAEPGPQAQPQLHEVLDYLGAHGAATVSIAASYDGAGAATAEDLARRRAAAVQELLIAQGVATERVTVAVSAADAGRSERVEVRVRAP